MTLPDLTARLNQYEKLMRLNKPIGILLLLWPTLWGLWVASAGQPNIVVVWIFILGTVLMRSAGCVINDYADSDFDRHVERTKDRPLATGSVSTKEALILAGALALMAFGLLLPLNRLTMLLSIPAVLIAASYPFTKRFLPIPQAYLGIAFSFGIPMAFAATQDTVPAIAWYLVLANLFWVVAYDTEYAMVDKPDDLKIGIKTSAITFGRFDAEAVMFCHALFLAGMVAIGWQLQRGLLWYLGLLIAALLMGVQYPRIKGGDRTKCFKAFLANNWIGAVLFAAIVLDYRFSIPI
ncbi:4-hydroxybenzoate octaprenyltransferase [Chitinimonas sp. BJB300]|uniref:4-hydroxybenzoate octaprenyltransferase n=1 Tax=Chitinimonas sp. BJB300 TaxID=1559339 RepID=UPI000C0DEDDA|nr:4-hydroxybenzoate octaprenyltransferase [Chitinimonas sp. BJB300]PHV11820.1 4-hydroxybenzoate octaprenyltransferase [Chitinimonas sp. BJB300]TSJ87031.1 4-hydroxybenzoate octaprenyltransferase [Chitinimonas sp. BJB300]